MRAFRTGSIVCALAILAGTIWWAQTLAAQDRIAADVALKYVGTTQTVCGVVASARYAPRTRGSPTFLNLDQPYPNQIFTAVIWGADRPKFSHAPEAVYADKRVCVSGEISNYRGVAEIVVTDPAQISLAK